MAFSLVSRSLVISSFTTSFCGTRQKCRRGMALVQHNQRLEPLEAEVVAQGILVKQSSSTARLAAAPFSLVAFTTCQVALPRGAGGCFHSSFLTDTRMDFNAAKGGGGFGESAKPCPQPCGASHEKQVCLTQRPPKHRWSAQEKSLWQQGVHSR